MNVISGGRGSGKTKRLIKAAADVDGIIVCANPDAMHEKIYGHGFSSIRVMSYAEYLMRETYDTEAKYFIDDIEAFLAALSDTCGNISGFTVCTG